MTGQLQLAAFGAVPALLAMAYFDRLDAKRPEPRATLRLVALAGALSAIPVVLLGEVLRMFGPEGVDGGTGGAPTTYGGALYLSFVIAALPEEAAKMACVLLFAWRRPEFDERMDGITYGARAGLGFALVENVAYLWLIPASWTDYVSMFIGRAVLAVPGHATWGAIIGYFAACRRFDGRGPGLLGGYLLAVALHGVYDACLFAAPVAIGHGYTFLALGVFGIPVIAYAVPTFIIAVGGLTLRTLARRAIARDDLDEARRRLAVAHAPFAPSAGFGHAGHGPAGPPPGPSFGYGTQAHGGPDFGRTPTGTVIGSYPPAGYDFARTPGGTVIGAAAHSGPGVAASMHAPDRAAVPFGPSGSHDHPDARPGTTPTGTMIAPATPPVALGPGWRPLGPTAGSASSADPVVGRGHRTDDAGLHPAMRPTAPDPSSIGDATRIDRPRTPAALRRRPDPPSDPDDR